MCVFLFLFVFFFKKKLLLEQIFTFWLRHFHCSKTMAFYNHVIQVLQNQIPDILILTSDWNFILCAAFNHLFTER